MEIRDMSLQDYCCLNRPRFVIDPQKDAEWYFGNLSVQGSIIERLKSDVDVRGVPKFGVWGRFGSGKTHMLYHLKHRFERSDQFLSFYVRVSPYTEEDPQTRGWGYIHRKILDAMGEKTLRDLVRASDRVLGSRERDLSEIIQEHLKFGDANLKQSLAYVLASFFLRETRSTTEAWDWLKGQGVCHGTTKKLETSADMIDLLLNLGKLARSSLKKAIVFLLDEGQALQEVKKASVAQIHDSFLQLAEPENEDVGFVLAIFGTGTRMLPDVIMHPTDIISRLGVTERNLGRAFIDLKDIVRTPSDFRAFAEDVLQNLIDGSRAKSLIEKYNLASRVNQNRIPFTDDALDRITQNVAEQEPNRNPRIIIGTLARLAAAAYQQAKSENTYVVADQAFVEPHLRDV
ncbi:MAG: hypothetical protein ACFFCW_02155 [Candidatus Hodarchaeota archaeon]